MFRAQKASSKGPQTEEEFAELGKRLKNIYLMGYIDKKEMLKMSFLKGVVTGFGGVLGATILVGLVIWLLSLFNHVPLIGPLISDVQNTVKSQKE